MMAISLPLGWLGDILGGQGTDDAAEEAGEAAGGDDEPEPWEVVLEAANIVQATIAQARLHDEAIPARVRRESASVALPLDVGILGRIEVMVPESMVERALDVLADVIEGFEDDGVT